MILFPPLPLKKNKTKTNKRTKKKRRKKTLKKNPKTVHVISPVTLISDLIHDIIINNDI